MNAVLTVKNLTIRRGDTVILRGLSWQVQRGDHWVILGANGSGKTSLLRALAGYLTPTGGTVEVLGKSFGTADWRALREQIGFVSASIAQLCHDEDTAMEIVSGGARAMIGTWGRVTPAERKRARSLLALLRIRRLADRRWEVLSQGERQRVLIARALMPRPPLLILDEPCSGLDPVARARFLADLHRLARRRNSPTLVLVTHHVEEIGPAFTHLLALRRGRVCHAGDLATGLTGPLLSEVFGAPVRLRTRQGKRTLDLLP
jgi:iron complex transport system ATP-binding protein